MSNAYAIDGVRSADIAAPNAAVRVTVRKHWPAIREAASFGLSDTTWDGLLSPKTRDTLGMAGITPVSHWAVSSNSESATVDGTINGRAGQVSYGALAARVNEVLHQQGLALSLLAGRTRVIGDDARADDLQVGTDTGAAVEDARREAANILTPMLAWLQQAGWVAVGAAVVIGGLYLWSVKRAATGK